MDFDKDFNRQEKINLGKKKLKKFRKNHNVSSGETSQDSLNSENTPSHSFSIPGTPNVNLNVSHSSPLSYHLNNTTLSQNNTNALVTNETNLTQIYNINEISQADSSIKTTNSNTMNNSKSENTYPTNPTDISINANSNNNSYLSSEANKTNITDIGINNNNTFTTSTTTSNNINYSVENSQSNYYSIPNTSNSFTYQTNVQNSYYPVENTGNNYSIITSNSNPILEEKKPTGSRSSSIRSGISGFVGSMFKNIIDAAAPPIAPEYLQKYKSSHNSSVNSLENENDNGMGNNFLVSNKAKYDDNTNNNDNSVINNPGASAEVEPLKIEEPEYMKNLSGNSNNNATPLFIQNSNLINNQVPPPPTSAVAPSQYIRSMPKKKKKWAAFTYNEDEIVVDRENYSKNPANAISLKDYMNQQQQKQINDTTKPSAENSLQEPPKSTSFIPPKATNETINTNMIVPGPPKIIEKVDTSSGASNLLSPSQTTPNANASFNLSPNVSKTPTPPPPKAESSINSSAISPPPRVESNISSSVTPPPPKAESNISSSVIPPPPKAGLDISSSVTPPPPMAISGVNSNTPSPMIETNNPNLTMTSPPITGYNNKTNSIPPPPKANTYNISASRTPPPPKNSAYPGFSVPSPANIGFNIPTPSYPTATSTYGTSFVPAVSTLSSSNTNDKIYNTATVIQDEKEDLSGNIDIDNKSNNPSVMGFIEENDNILLSSPHIDSSVIRNHKNVNPKLHNKTSFSSLIKNPDVIELTSSSNVTTPVDKSETYSNASDLFNSIGNENNLFMNNNPGLNNNGNENLNDILLNNNLKGNKKTKNNYSLPLENIMASPFGIHPKINTKVDENTETKLNESASFDLEPISMTSSTKNEICSETISPDDASSLFGVTRKSKEVAESSSLHQSFVPNDDSNDNEPSPSVAIKKNPINDNLLLSSNVGGTKNIDNKELPYTLIDDLENVNISESTKSKKTPFNKDISLVSPEKLNEMSDIPLDENIPEQSTRQYITSKIFSETAKAKNLLSGMFPIRDNKSEGSVGKLMNLAFSSHSENNSSEPTTNYDKANETEDNAILKPSTEVEIEQNVLFTGSDNNDNQGIFINQSDIKIDEKSSPLPLSVNTLDTPKPEQLFATPTEQRKTGILYSSNMETASNLFGESNKSDNNQLDDEFMSYINKDNSNNNTEFTIQQSQDKNVSSYNNQNENIPFSTTENVDMVVNNSFYNQSQDNSIPFFTSDNDNSNGFSNDTHNQKGSAKFYISSGNATPINSDMYNNSESSFPLSGTTSPIKNEINPTSNISTPLKTEVVNQPGEVLAYKSQTTTPIQNEASSKNEKIPFFNSQITSPIRNEVSNQNDSIPFYNSQTTSPINNESTNQNENVQFYSNNSLPIQSNNQNDAVPFFNVENNNQKMSYPTFTINNQDNNILFFNDDKTKNQQNNTSSFNTNNQIPFYSQSENTNTSFNNESPSANIFDTVANQNNDTNVNFFDNGIQENNNGGNWFEQFSQSNESFVTSEIINNESVSQNGKDEKSMSPKLEEEKLTNELNEISKDKENKNIIEENNIINQEELIKDNKAEKQSKSTGIETEQIVVHKTIDEKGLTKLNNELEDSNNKVTSDSEIIKKLNSQIEEQKKKNNALIDKIKTLEHENDENIKKIKQNEKNIDNLNSLIKMKDQQIDLLKEESENDSENKDNSNELDKMNNLLKEKINIIEELTIENQNLKNEKDKQKQLLEVKENELNTCKNKIKELSDEINRISSSDNIENKLKEFSNQIQELQSLINEKDKQKDEILKEKQLIESESKEQLDRLEESKNSYLQLQNNCSILQEEIKKSKEQNANLEQEMTLIKFKYDKIEKINNEEKDFLQKMKELYPNLPLSEIVDKISNITIEKEVVQPKPLDPSKTNNIQELNWNDIGNTDNKEEFENYINDSNLNAFTPQPMILPITNEQVKKYEIENNELKEKCSSYEKVIEKNKAEIEYLKDLINNHKPLDYVEFNDSSNDGNHNLIEIISQLTKDNQALNLQIQELRNEVNSNNQVDSNPLTFSNQPYDNINTSSSFSYPPYMNTTQPPTDLMYNQLYSGNNMNGNTGIENNQGLSSYTSPYENIIDNKVYEQPGFDMNYYNNRALSTFTTPSSTYDHQQLLNQLDEREKNERNKMLASTS